MFDRLRSEATKKTRRPPPTKRQLTYREHGEGGGGVEGVGVVQEMGRQRWWTEVAGL